MNHLQDVYVTLYKTGTGCSGVYVLMVHTALFLEVHSHLELRIILILSVAVQSIEDVPSSIAAILYPENTSITRTILTLMYLCVGFVGCLTQ